MKDSTVKMKKPRFSRYLEQILYAVDIAVLNVSFLIALLLRTQDLSALWNKDYQLLLVFANILWLSMVQYKSALKSFRVERVESVLKKLLAILVLHFGVLSALVLFMNFDDISRLSFLYFYFIFSGLVLVARISAFKFLKFYRAQGYNYRRVVIVGCNDIGKRMHDMLSNDLTFGFKVKGFFDDAKCDHLNADYLGTINDIEAYLQGEGVDEMYVALRHKQHDKIEKLIHICEKYLVRIKFIPDFRVYTKAKRVSIDLYDGIPVMMFRKEPLEEPVNRIFKRIFDLSFSLFVIVTVFSWLFPILALLIKLSSPGPIFFKQKRSGEDNRSFTCYKFRTMRVNKLSDELQASKNDPRITRIGAFMRKTNLDEFPQFFNVLYGTMSVVGPRPHMLAHTEQYSRLIGNYLVRHFAKPGITGWAQVNGYRGETKELKDMEGRVKCDIYYVENWSFFLDMKIIWRTVFNMFRGEEKAY